MSALTAERTALAVLLDTATGDSVRVSRTVPEELTGLDVVIQPASPYVRPDDEYLDVGEPIEVEQTVDIVILVGAESNEGVHDAIDVVLADIIPALVGTPWHITTTSRIQTLATSEWTTYGMTLTAVRTTTLTP